MKRGCGPSFSPKHYLDNLCRWGLGKSKLLRKKTVEEVQLRVLCGHCDTAYGYTAKVPICSLVFPLKSDSAFSLKRNRSSARTAAAASKFLTCFLLAVFVLSLLHSDGDNMRMMLFLTFLTILIWHLYILSAYMKPASRKLGYWCKIVQKEQLPVLFCFFSCAASDFIAMIKFKRILPKTKDYSTVCILSPGFLHAKSMCIYHFTFVCMVFSQPKCKKSLSSTYKHPFSCGIPLTSWELMRLQLY